MEQPQAGPGPEVKEIDPAVIAEVAAVREVGIAMQHRAADHARAGRAGRAMALHYAANAVLERAPYKRAGAVHSLAQLCEALQEAIDQLAPESCPHCGEHKMPGTTCKGNDQCIEGPDGGPAECCLGWGSYCCRCGADYARGQMP